MSTRVSKLPFFSFGLSIWNTLTFYSELLTDIGHLYKFCFVIFILHGKIIYEHEYLIKFWFYTYLHNLIHNYVVWLLIADSLSFPFHGKLHGLQYQYKLAFVSFSFIIYKTRIIIIHATHLVAGSIKKNKTCKDFSSVLGNISLNFGYYIVILAVVHCAIGSTHTKGKTWWFGTQLFWPIPIQFRNTNWPMLVVWCFR